MKDDKRNAVVEKRFSQDETGQSLGHVQVIEDSQHGNLNFYDECVFIIC